MTIVIYGIPNCDSVKKTRKWLEQHDVTYHFHDFRKDGVNKKQIGDWCKALGWETVLNKRGTTFRSLSDADKNNLNQSKAISLMQQQPTLIKRPVVEHNNEIFVGFSEASLKKIA